METWVNVLRAIWCILLVAGLIPNIIVAYFVLFRTPNEFKSYGVILINFAITEMCSAFANWFVMERCIPSTTGLSFAAYGPCSFLGARACFVGHTFMMHTYCNLVLIQALSFAYRRYVLSHPSPRRRKVIGVSLLVYLPSMFCVVALNLIYAGPEVVRPTLLDSKYQDLYNSTIPVYGLTDIHTWQNYYTLGLIMMAFPSYVIVLTLRHLVLKKIDEFAQKLSPKTQQMHRTLVKALTLQACVPLVTVFALLTFLVGQFGLINHPAVESSTFLVMCLVPILNGSITIVYVPYYRSIVRGWVKAPPLSAVTIEPMSRSSRSQSTSFYA